MTTAKNDMGKRLMVSANECGEMCMTLAKPMMGVNEDTFSTLTESECVTLAADMAQAQACLMNVQTMLNRCM